MRLCRSVFSRQRTGPLSHFGYSARRDFTEAAGHLATFRMRASASGGPGVTDGRWRSRGLTESEVDLSGSEGDPVGKITDLGRRPHERTVRPEAVAQIRSVVRLPVLDHRVEELVASSAYQDSRVVGWRRRYGDRQFAASWRQHLADGECARGGADGQRGSRVIAEVDNGVRRSARGR